MKPRRVIVTIEMDTPATLAILRNMAYWRQATLGYGWAALLRHVTVNVKKAEKGGKKP